MPRRGKRNIQKKVNVPMILPIRPTVLSLIIQELFTSLMELCYLNYYLIYPDVSIIIYLNAQADSSSF